MQHGEKSGSHTTDGSAVKFYKLLDIIIDGSYIALQPEGQNGKTSG